MSSEQPKEDDIGRRSDNVSIGMMLISLFIGIGLGLVAPYIGNKDVAMPDIHVESDMCLRWCNHEAFCGNDVKCNVVWNNSCDTHCNRIKDRLYREMK